MPNWSAKTKAWLRGIADSELTSGTPLQSGLEQLKNRLLGGKPQSLESPSQQLDISDSIIFPADDKLNALGMSPLAGKPVFTHPLSGEKIPLEFQAASDINEVLSRVAVGFPTADAAVLDWLLWRAWLPLSALKANKAGDSGHPLAYLAGDTRVTDETIWHQRSFLSALESTRGADGQLHPAFLIFKVGPVYELAAQSNTAHDLWSGSVMVSWLMAHVLSEISHRLGPESVLCPSLRGQPSLDWLNRRNLQSALFTEASQPARSFWGALGLSEATAEPWWQTAMLPNRFLALVPADFEVAPLAGIFDATKDKSPWRQITDACWSFLTAMHPLTAGQRHGWDFQISHFWRITWQIWPWLDTDETLRELAQIPGGKSSSLWISKNIAEAIPVQHREERDFPLSSAWAWEAHYQLALHRFQARCQTNNFSAWDSHALLAKDSLSSREDAILDVTWLAQVRNVPVRQELLSDKERLGAINLIKRIWFNAFLVHQLREESASKASIATPIVARPTFQHAPQDLAVLVLKGDQMGQWFSGTKAPALKQALSEPAARYFLETVSHPEMSAWLESHRPASPAYQMQISEALANFSLYAVGRVVQAHHGQLIRAWGDNVLVLLTVEGVISCARDLRLAYQGSPDLASQYPNLFQPTYPGFIHLKNPGANEPVWPILMPGSKATVSAGIAMNRDQIPLGSLVTAAFAALQRAAAKPLRKILDRSTGQLVDTRSEGWGGNALAVTIIDRTGKALHWGASFDSPAFKLLELPLAGGLAKRIAGLLGKYKTEQPLDAELASIAQQELTWLLHNQVAGTLPSAAGGERLASLCRACLDSLLHHEFHDGREMHPAPRPLREFINLFWLKDFLGAYTGAENMDQGHVAAQTPASGRQSDNINAL